MSSIFQCNIGDYVVVDPEVRVGRRDSEGGSGFIVGVSEEAVAFEYVISRLVSPVANRRRLHKSNICNTTGRRRSVDGGRTPSILDYTYPEYRRQQRLIAESTDRTADRQEPVRLFDDCCRVSDDDIDTRVLLSMSLNKKCDVIKTVDRMNNSYEKGWLRK